MATTPADSVRRSAYSSADPLQVREFLERAYGARMRLGADDGDEPRQVSLTQTQIGPVTAAELDVPLDLAFETTGQGDYVFTTLLDGTSQRDAGDDSERFRSGDLFFAIDPHEDCAYTTHRARTRNITLAAWLVDDVADDALGDPTASWRFSGRRPVPGGTRRWNQTVAVVLDAMADPQASATALVMGPASRLLAATALTVFPNTRHDLPQTTDRHDAHPVTLRRAIAFIDTHPDLDITLTTIARAAHVTPRAIQLAFRRHLDTTPMGYLRQVRLHHAHLALKDAVPGDGQTVTRIAIDWGFMSPSRFAVQYRATYGEPPSTTLRR